MSLEMVQTVALCLIAFALLVIAFSAFLLMIRIVTMITPFDLLADIMPGEADEEDYIIDPGKQSDKRRKRR